MTSMQNIDEQHIRELSGRFYAIEVFIISISSALLYHFAMGDSPNNGTIPFTNFVVKDTIALMQILFGLVMAGLIVLDCEWFRYRDAKKNISDTFQYVFCLFISVMTSLITYPSIVQNTSFQNISRWQWLAMIICGVMFGRVCSNIRNAFRFIRPKEYARKVHALRVPIMTKMSFLLNGTGVLLIFGLITVINFLCGQQTTIYPYLAFFATAVYFGVRWQLAMTPESIKKERDLIELTDNFAYEKYAAPILLSSKWNNDKTPLQFARHSGREEFRTFNVQTLEVLHTSMFEDVEPQNMNDSICVDISCMGQVKKQQVSLWFIYEAFKQLRCENINNEDDLLQESIFWATMFAFFQDQYKNVPQDRTDIIVRFVFAGFPFIVSMLLKSGKCNLNELLYRGWTPLLAAAAQNEFEIAGTLLSHGANPDKANLKGITPLMYTARYNHHKTCKTILAHSPNLNLQDEEGSTAVIVAVKNNSIEVFNLLLEAGADLSIKDNSGKTALDWAYQNGLGEFARKIKNKLNN